jgi:hypothetical protein
VGLKIDGPGVGDSIGSLRVFDDMGDPVSLAEMPGRMLIIDVFRGHW